MSTQEQIKAFFGVNFDSFRSRIKLELDDVLFVAKLDNVTKKKALADPTRKAGFGSLFNELASSVVEKVAVMTDASYVIGMIDQTMYFLPSMRDASPFHAAFGELVATPMLDNERVRVDFTFGNQQSLEHAELILTGSNTGTQMLGELSDVVRFFFRSNQVIAQQSRISSCYYRIRVFEQKAVTQDSVEGFNFKFKSETLTLIGFQDDKLTGLYMNTIIAKQDVICHSFCNNVCTMLVTAEDKYLLYVICHAKDEEMAKEIRLSNNNLVVSPPTDVQTTELDPGILDFAGGTLHANALLMAVSMLDGQGRLVRMLIKDDELFVNIDSSTLGPEGTCETGRLGVGGQAGEGTAVDGPVAGPGGYTLSSIFFREQYLYIVSYAGQNIILQVPQTVIDQLDGLSVRFDQYFNEGEMLQFVINADTLEFEPLKIMDTWLELNHERHDYINIINVKVESMSGCCKVRLQFKEDGHIHEFIGAKEIAYHFWRQHERATLEHRIDTVPLEELYEYLNILRLNRFLVGTFGEILKADRIMNMNTTISEVLIQVNATENLVLRSYMKNLKAKFLEVEDLQAILVKKVSMVEMHRKSIVALMNEWAVVYPHFMGEIERNWLNTLYGDHVDRKFVDSERWKAIGQFKAVLMPVEERLSKMLDVIGSCTLMLRDTIPEEIRAVDPTKKLRLAKNVTTAQQLEAASNLAIGVTAGAGLVEQLAQGLTSMADPAYLIISTKIIAENFSKDNIERKNIKSFGSQALSWWDNMMNVLRVLIVEAVHEFKVIAEERVKRDHELLQHLNPHEREQFQDKLGSLIAEELKEMSEDKFYETIPQYGIFLANIIDDLEEIASDYSSTIGSFKEHLIL